jgi:hypothetical protein
MNPFQSCHRSFKQEKKMNRTKFNNEIYTKVKPSEIKQKHKKIECHSVQYRPKIREEE